MDYKNGNNGYPPYEDDLTSAGQDPNAPRPYRDDPAAYGATPISYGQDPSAYGSNYDGYPANASGAPVDDYSARHPRTNYGEPQDQQAYVPRSSAYGAGAEYAPVGSNGYAQPGAYSQAPVDETYTPRSATGRYYSDPDSAYTTRRAPVNEDGSYVQRGYTGRTTMPPAEDGYGYSPRGNTARTTIPQGADGYVPRGNTARTTMPQGEEGYVSRGNTARTTIAQADDGYATRGNTSRTRYPQDNRSDMDDDDYYEREPRSPRGKKKRSKFGKFMHALGLYLAQMPAKTLVVIGGTFAMVLVAIILLAVLLPNSERTERPDDGQLAIADVTVTPSLAPTNTPVPTESTTPTPELPPLTDNISVAGATSDLIPSIQARLVELGYMEEPEGGYTNKYGPTTKTAIRLFQMRNFDSSDDWDGIIGQGTYALLMSDQAKAYFLTRGDGDDRTKVITKLVQDVTDLQNRLITLGYLTPGSATGLYGATTVQAVQLFQEYHGLTPIDGKAGQATLKLIYSAEAMDATTGKANNKSKITPAPGASTSPSVSTSTSPAVTSPSVSPSVTPVP